MRRVVQFLLLLAIGGAAVWGYPLVSTFLKYGAIPKNLEQPMTILVMGVAPEYKYFHQRAKEDFRGLSDVNLLVRLDPVTNRISILSVPRDVNIDIPEYGTYIINHANKFGGPALAKTVFSSLTEIPIDAYLSVSVEAIRDSVDALGGVNVCVEKPMQYTDTAAKLDIDLQPGCQKMDGPTAEGFLRFRHDALGDIGRIQRQQSFFQALKAQVLSPAGLVTLPKAISALDANAKTDLTKDQIAQILGFARKHPEMVSFLTPGKFGIGWEVDEPELKALVSKYFKSADAQQATQVANGDIISLKGRYTMLIYGKESEAVVEHVQATLEEKGLKVLLREQETSPRVSEVLSNTDEPGATALGKVLNLPSRVTGEADLWTDLTVRIGPDYSLEVPESK